MIPSDRPVRRLLDTQPAHTHSLPGSVMFVVGLLGIAALLLHFGFRTGRRVDAWLTVLEVILAAGFTYDLLLLFARSGDRRRTLREHWYDYAAMLLIVPWLALAALAWLSPSGGIARALGVGVATGPGALAAGGVQLYLLFNVVVRIFRMPQKILNWGVRPELVLTGTFALLVLAGSFLLLLPRITSEGTPPMKFVDALFMATSATCVTGLSVRDIGTELSTFGQMTMLVLIQLGGLGIMTFVAMLSIFSGRSLSIPQLVVLRDMFSARGISDVRKQVTVIVLGTLLIEACGVVALYLALPASPDPVLHRIKWCLFHSVSAFCNAGLSLDEANLAPYRDNWGVVTTVMVLIVLGGMGFLVLGEFISFRVMTIPVLRRWGFHRHWQPAAGPPSRIHIQARLAVLVTLFLIVLGALGFWLLEVHHTLRGMSLSQQFLQSMFQSITPRTAGFNTVSIGGLRDATLLLLMGLMVVGASPLSTGGGIKTVTLGVLFLTLRSMLTGSTRVEVFGRVLPMRTVFAAISVFVIYVVVAAGVTFILSITEPRIPLRDTMFETISALSTVGLSTGITPQLSPASKLVLCLAMFAGRVGPLSLVLAVLKARSLASRYDYPEEEVVVG